MPTFAHCARDGRFATEIISTLAVDRGGRRCARLGGLLCWAVRRRHERDRLCPAERVESRYGDLRGLGGGFGAVGVRHGGRRQLQRDSVTQPETAARTR